MVSNQSNTLQQSVVAILPKVDCLVCPICSGKVQQKLETDLWRCFKCKYWFSSFTTNPVQLQQHSTLLEPQRQRALKHLREKNYRQIIRVLSSIRSLEKKKLCDVGCSYGWFLQVAEEHGIDTLGIEPEESIALIAQTEGNTVRIGYFPDCLRPDEQFDIIIFNDVFEHLPNPKDAIQSCYRYLSTKGLVVINAPSSKGLFFRLACLLRRIGIKLPLNRLWQRSFHSPHLSYFNPQNLTRVMEDNKFCLIHSGKLMSLERHGLWDRLRMDKNNSLWSSLLLFPLLTAISYIISMFPSDILLSVFEKK